MNIKTLLICLQLSGAYSESHTYQTYYTAVSDPEGKLPLFTAVIYVDDYHAGVYTSDSKEFRIKTEWIRQKVHPATWEVFIPRFQLAERMSKHRVNMVTTLFNHTKGFHSYQWMFGCELRDDGSIQGYDQHGYDGRDFISLDRERGIFVPTMDEARLTAQRLNSPELNVQEHMRNFLDKICVDRLKKYINYGREEMERRVVPGVKVSHRQSDGVTKLHCRVYGFYPRTVDVKWVKNGRDDVYSEEAKQILPNPDGTYQTRVTVEVDPKEGDSYSCHVDHSSLNSTLIVAWDPKKDRGFWHIVIGAVAAVTVIVGLIGLFMWKKRTDYALTTSSDSDSSPASQAI